MWPFRRADDVPSFTVENTIGTGTTVRGDLTGTTGFRVDGTVEGSIDAQGPVVIGESGAVNGGIRGREVVVLGRVRGDVIATGHLEVGPNGKIIGDVTVESFRMHKGGVFRGTSRMAGGDEVLMLSPTIDTQPIGLAPPKIRPELRARGRTLPPPDGAVPPPALVPDDLVSEERLITSGLEDVTDDAKTGTD